MDNVLDDVDDVNCYGILLSMYIIVSFTSFIAHQLQPWRWQCRPFDIIPLMV
jgi:hypothetical protein